MYVHGMFTSPASCGTTEVTGTGRASAKSLRYVHVGIVSLATNAANNNNAAANDQARISQAPSSAALTPVRARGRLIIRSQPCLPTDMSSSVRVRDPRRLW